MVYIVWSVGYRVSYYRFGDLTESKQTFAIFDIVLYSVNVELIF